MQKLFSFGLEIYLTGQSFVSSTISPVRPKQICEIFQRASGRWSFTSPHAENDVVYVALFSFYTALLLSEYQRDVCT